MNLKEAREDIGCSFEEFKHIACVFCNNDWYCPSPCEMLLKAEKIDYDRILKCYARHEGDWYKVFRYIKNTKINRKRGGY